MSIRNSILVDQFVFLIFYFFLIFFLNKQTYGDTSSQENLIPSQDECNTTFCDECSTYPVETIKKVVDNGSSCQKQNMSNPASSTEMKNTTTLAEDKKNEDEKEILLCTVEDKVIKPKVGRTIRGKMRYIVQSSEVNQTLTVQVCKHPEKECNYIEGCVKSNYKSVCKQNYTFRKFTVLNTDGNLAQEIFVIAAGCICKLFKIE